ncbi:hypothetical protein ACLKA6_009721 [Drosophila palustris]
MDVKVREIADILKISAGSVHTIIHEHLGMKKVFSKWVPRLLTPEQNNNQSMNQRAVWTCLRAISRSFCVGTSQWMKHGSTISLQSQIGSLLMGMQPVKAAQSDQRRSSWLARLWRSWFWDAHGIIFIDYLQKGQTINSDYYMALLERLKDEIAKKRPHITKKKSVVPPRQCTVSQINENNGKIERIRLRIASHPLYSPDLAPSDYWLFADLKKMLRVARYQAEHPEVHQASAARYQAEHPKVHQASAARYQAEHPEVHQASAARYQAEHPDVNQAAVARYQAEHPEVHQASTARYQAEHPKVHQASAARYQAEHPEA